MVQIESELKFKGGAMVITISSSVLSGYSGVAIKIELDVSRGFPKFLFVGLADTMVKESKERVRVVLEGHGYKMPHKKVTVNFVPANVKKVGSHLDLAIAIALAGVISLKTDVLNQIKSRREEIGVFGELNLNGDVVEVKEIIPLLVSLQEKGIKKFIIPEKNVQSAKLLKEIEVIGVRNIFEAILAYFGSDPECKNAMMESNQIFSAWCLHPKTDVPESTFCKGEYEIRDEHCDDFDQVLGQKIARRACEIAVSGMHNLLMMGSPGCGKSMLAKRMISIMPELSYEEILELTKIYSVSNLKQDPVITKRPFRSPNNAITNTALCGGGSPIKIGEISLSHRGILFLDEFLEFKKNVIESLRAPMEDGKICISRVNETLELPCDFLLVGAFNPCPCGFLNDEYKNCKCSPYEIRKYISHLSGPILDRFDLQIHLKRVNYEDLRSAKREECSRDILKRVKQAREIQQKRFGSRVKLNSNMTLEDIKKYCVLDLHSEEKLQMAYQKMNLSARSLNSILKVARTIADLEHSEAIQSNHLLEAIQYRRIDMIFERYT